MGYDESKMALQQLPATPEKPGQNAMFPHQCPICGKGHWVNAARHSVAWGKQFTCSRECEIRRRRRWKHCED